MPFQPVDRERLLEFFQHAPERAYSIRRLQKELELKNKHRPALEALVHAMVEEGVLQAAGREAKFRLAGAETSIMGRLQGHRSGFAFLIRDDHGGPDIFIPPSKKIGTFHNDRVEAVIESAPTDPRPYGAVVRLIERGRSRLVGRFSPKGAGGRVEPDDLRYGFDVEVPARLRGSAQEGQIVIVDITDWPDARCPNAQGAVVKVLGAEDDDRVEEALVLEKYGLEAEFPEAVRRAAERIPDQVGEADRIGRFDLRDLPLVTIDGETARDFDDAVCVLPEEGGWRLVVAIADVSHYVRPGSPIDQEAFSRSTSVYFPNRVIPMLPERLSNGICSLNPGVERLAMTADMHFDPQGREKPGETRFGRAVFQSRHRLTYTRVHALLNTEAEASLSGPDREVLALARPMRDLARKIRERRMERGALDFDLPESEFVINEDGFVEGIRRRPRNEAHQIIEDFMIAANESVARRLTAGRKPCLYRIHEPPDARSLAAFEDFLRTVGLSLGRYREIHPRVYQAFLARLKGHPEETMIHMVMLRSMMQARYDPTPLGHFGLASTGYAHFTSPIRRYPDLIVHRLLGMMIDGAVPSTFREIGKTLGAAGEHTSERERNAVEAEREYEKLKKAHFMARHLGNRYAGRIVGVTAFGLFVELEEIFVEGLVAMESLTDDHYRFEEDAFRWVGLRTGRVFKLGMPLEVVVSRVDIRSRRILLELGNTTVAPERFARTRRARSRAGPDPRTPPTPRNHLRTRRKARSSGKKRKGAPRT